LLCNQLGQLVDALCKGDEMMAERSSHAEVPLPACFRGRHQDAPVARARTSLAHLSNPPSYLACQTDIGHHFDYDFEVHCVTLSTGTRRRASSPTRSARRHSS